MAISTKLQHELVAILSAGASLELSAKARLQHDLVALARAAREGGSQLRLTDISTRLQHDLLAIARAGNGHVTLLD
ncbi:hypothetical protein [Pseudomonas asiatica]|uniref:hypothetical protein n=1 Tax=Pseudomonas asiatica TaxID=2219225 RepID=UPI00399BB406